MNYYYLAASLPALSLDSAPPIGLNAFEQTSEEHLTRHDMEGLRAVLKGTDAPHAFVRAWRGAETQLRNAIALARARRVNRDAGGFLREHEGFDSAVEKTVGDAYSAATPLERERILDNWRWTHTEDLAGTHEFTGDAVLAYGVRLMLVHRWAAFSEEAGNDTLDRMVASEPADGKQTQSAAPEREQQAA